MKRIFKVIRAFVYVFIIKYTLAALNILRLWRMELLYQLHVRFRKVHDTAYQKMPVYRSATESPYAMPVKRATYAAFFVSLFIFLTAQYLLPNIFNPFAPGKVQAATNSYSWGVVPPNNAAFSTATTNSNIDFTTTPGSVQQSIPAFSPQGDGHDSALTVSTAFNINTQTNGYNSRTAADGVIWTITSSVSSGQTTISSGTTRPTGFAIGDEIMIIDLKGTSGDYSNVGLYELKKVLTLPNSTSITVDSNLANTYNGTTQKIVVQRVPNYTNVTVNTGGSIVPNTWDGTSGGVLAFRANGTISVASSTSINADGKGYKGGLGTGYASNSNMGEYYAGGNIASGGTDTSAGINLTGGGGGGYRSGSTYAGGTGGANVSAGGGGGGCFGGTGLGNSCLPARGGGGGYGTVGHGGYFGYGAYASDGSGANQGSGAAGNSATVYGGGGGGGGTYGNSTTLLSRAYLGSGSGASGGKYDYYGTANGSNGGNGGGLVFIGGYSLTNSGTISVKGSGNGNQTEYGSGGSLVIQVKNITNSGLLSTVGEYGVTGGTGYGNGRSYLAYVGFTGSAVSDTVNSTTSYGYQTPATLGSPVAGSVGLRYDAGAGANAHAASLTWVTNTTITAQNVKFKVRSGNTQAELDTNQCYGPGNGTAGTGLDSGCADWTTANKFFTTTLGSTGSTNIAVDTAITSKRYIEVFVRLESSGANTPILNSVQLNYDSLESPANTSTTLYKSDGTTQLKDSAGNLVAAGAGSAWTNETGLKISNNALSCSGCAGTLTGRKLQVQYNSVNTAFADETTNVVDGTSVDNGNGTFTSVATLSGLAPGTGYHLRMRAKDDAGRVSAWQSYGGNTDVTVADFSVEQTNPNIASFTIGTGVQYTSTNSQTLNISASDTGGSSLSQMQFSNDGTNWGKTTDTNGNITDTGWASYATTYPWYLTSGDGAKNVYARVRDNAGNISGKTFTSQADWQAGTISQLDATSVSGDLKLQANSGSVAPDFGTGADGDATITSGSVTIQTLYENDAVTGVTTTRGAGKGLNKGAGTYNPSTGAVPNFNNFTINSGTTLTSTGPSGANPGVKIEFKVKATLTIQSTASINASGMGYAANYGPGTATGTVIAPGNYGGGGFGGRGGNGGSTNGAYFPGASSQSGGTSYSVTTSVFGSGGGNGGSGGGAIKLQATSLVLAGNILANGNNGSGTGGAGSGGSIYMISQSSSLSSYNISANGGTGVGAPTSGAGTGGGGGGVIIIQNNTSLTATASGGAGGPQCCNTTYYQDGNPGYVGAVNNYSIFPYSQTGTLGETGTALSFDSGPGVVRKWDSLSWSAEPLITGQSIKYLVSIDGTNWVGPSGAVGDWNSNFFGQSFGASASSLIPNSLNASRNVYIKVKMASSGNDTPVLHDLSILADAAATITLDTAPPAAFSLSGPANNIWQGSATPTLSWNATTDAGSGINHYELCVDARACQNAGTSTSFAVSPALTEGTHTWYAKAFDTVGNTTNSTETWTIGYDATPPGAPLSFSVTGAVSTITLAWDFTNNAGSPVSSVRAERIDWGNYDPLNPNADWSAYASYHVKIYAGDSTGAVYSVTDIDPDTKVTQGKKYAYRVSAKDAVNAAWGTNSAVQAGLTQDSIFDATVQNVAVAPCDGTLNCSTNPNVRHKGFEVKITWNPALDSGVGTSHYLVYRSTQVLNAGNYQDPNVRNSYQIVGVLPFVSGQQTVWYDNDANNDGITTFYDANGSVINISPAIQALTTKTVATTRLVDYSLYYYRVVGVDLNNNKSTIFNESPTPADYDVLKAFQNGNQGTAAERTPDVTPPSIPLNVNPVATGIDDQNSTPEPTQGIMISWDFSTDNSGRAVTYKLYQATGDSVGPTSWNTTPIFTGINTSFQQKGLAQNSYYYYKVTAQDPDNNVSAESIYKGVKTKDSQVPTTPTFVTVRATKGDPAATNSVVGKQINVQFNGSTIRFSSNKITGYEVYRATTNFSTEAQWLASATLVQTYSGLNFAGYDGTLGPNSYDATRNFDDTVATDATTYYYRVRAIGSNSNGVVQSGLSSIQTATLYYGWDTTPDATAPDLPAELAVKDIHDDGLNFKRNIVTWARINTPLRLGANDFKEYRVYRSNDGLTWQQICKNNTSTILLNQCTAQYPNPLANSDKELALANNYFMDLIPISQSNQFYYYYVTSVDDSGDNFKYANGQIINQIGAVSYYNESKPARKTDGNILSVSLNPAIARPTIVRTGANQPSLLNLGVSTATLQWYADQLTDSVVEFRAESDTKWITIGDRVPKDANEPHIVTLFGLKPKTHYFYKLISRNSLGNEDIVGGDTPTSYAGLPTVITQEFSITTGAVVTTTSTAELKWSTNLDASSAFVEYTLQRQPGDDPQSGTAGASPDDLAAYPKDHTVVIKGLRSARTYTYKIKSISKDGFLAETDFLTFRTNVYDTSQFTIAPSTSNVAERNITATTAQIVWQTGIPTTSHVDYATADLSTNPPIIAAGNNDLVTTHVILIEGLVPGTKYFYRVWGDDANEQRYTSQPSSFTAVLKPKISNMTVRDVTPYSVMIAWETNVDTETLINWGTTANYGEKKGISGYSKAHQLKVENLLDNQEYHYQILAKDDAGNEVADSDKIVRTPLDTEGPKISNAKLDVLPMGDSDTTSSVIISWNTNKPATTLVEYDQGILGSPDYQNRSTEDISLNTSHTVIVKNLQPASSYHYHMVSKDKRGNNTVSQDYTFVTPTKEKSILQLILKSLEETFSWTKNLNQFFGNIGKRFGGK